MRKGRRERRRKEGVGRGKRAGEERMRGRNREKQGRNCRRQPPAHPGNRWLPGFFDIAGRIRIWYDGTIPFPANG